MFLQRANRVALAGSLSVMALPGAGRMQEVPSVLTLFAMPRILIFCVTDAKRRAVALAFAAADRSPSR